MLLVVVQITKLRMRKYLSTSFQKFQMRERSGEGPFQEKIWISQSIHRAGVCRKHWPPSPDCKMMSVHGKSRPADPPSVFDSIPRSCLSSPPPKVRATEKTSFSARNVQPPPEDELAGFQQFDKFVLEEIPSKMSNDNSVVVYKSNS